MRAYNVRKKKMVEIVKVLEEKRLKNGTIAVIGLDASGDKVSTIRRA